jgi:hypothetical protein
MNSNPTTILITGYQLQKALAYVAPDLTRAQLEDMVAIQASPSDGQLLAGTATLAGEENLIIDLDGDFMWPRQHPDDRMVDQWASDVKDNMAKRAGRNRRDPAHQGRLADGWVSGVFQSCGWDAQNWTARQISAGLVEHLYRQDMLEVAIHALVLRERDQRFDRRQLRETIPPQALTVAAQMRLAAQSMSQPGHPEIDADQLIAWADQIVAARDVRSNTEQLAAAPFMFEALLADHNAVLAERAHNALVQQPKPRAGLPISSTPGKKPSAMQPSSVGSKSCWPSTSSARPCSWPRRFNPRNSAMPPTAHPAFHPPRRNMQTAPSSQPCASMSRRLKTRSRPPPECELRNTKPSEPNASRTHHEHDL